MNLASLTSLLLHTQTGTRQKLIMECTIYV